MKQAQDDFIILLNNMCEDNGLNPLEDGERVCPNRTNGVTVIPGTGLKGEVEGIKFLRKEG